MKFIMVIIICFGANCQTIFEQDLYSSRESCNTSAESVKQYLMDTYPGSAGEIYCMTEQEFKNFSEQDNTGKPSGDPA